MTAAERIPVTVLTGYLGSGKTTLLQRLLERREAARAAVLVNEFGEISLDHLLARPVVGNTVVLQNGCVCCSVRSELRDSLRELIDGRQKKTVPQFDRIVIETTGLADPVPLVQTIVVDPMLRHHIRLANLVATIDGLNASHQIAWQSEAKRQAATADRLVITKADLCQADQVERLEGLLRAINPTAPILRACDDARLWPMLLGSDPFDPASKGREIGSWFACAEALDAEQSGDAVSASRHEAVGSYVFRTTRRMDWGAFAVWLSLLVHRHGRNVLRVKGLLDVPGRSGPMCINAVQNFIHPPVHLDAWPDNDHASRLVFIVQGISHNSLRASLMRMLDLTHDVQAKREAV